MDSNNLLINSTKDHLYKIFPHAERIEIKVQQDDKQNFTSSIQIRIAHNKDFYAHKSDLNIKKSLDKSTQAIVRQIHRLKTRWQKHHDRTKITNQLEIDTLNYDISA